MIQKNEQNVLKAAVGITALILIALPVILFTMRPAGISRIPVQEIYSQGIALNFYVNYILPIVIVLAILFIAGLSTFGLYHEATREQLGKKPLIIRPIEHIIKKMEKKTWQK
ncbi:MAG: hypothetical protein Q7J35_12755 [Candidatus Methanoperedens sp.]|nr:hypothetical protein [Candidatus Methanoperedens sp.]